LCLQAQKDGGIRDEKVLNVSVNSASRWNGVYDTVGRNNVVSEHIDAVLATAPNPTERSTHNDAHDEASATIQEALVESFGKLASRPPLRPPSHRSPQPFSRPIHAAF